MIEVEVKCELLPGAWPRLMEVLAPMHLVHQGTNIDIYYDTVHFDLLRQAAFVRVRNQQWLEWKWNERAAPAHVQCQEAVFSLQSEPQQAQELHKLFRQFLPRWQEASTVEEALHYNSLLPLAHIKNRRAEYREQDLVVCVDQVEGLGAFVEIEIKCETDSDTRQAEERIRAVAARLAARQVRVGYVELWLQKYHPQAYQVGKYHVERDFA